MTRRLLLAVVAGWALAWAWSRPSIPAEPGTDEPIPGFEKGPDMDRVVPDKLMIDPPTLENLGFRWYIKGDSNRNASVQVAYRQAHQTEWKDALPMLRVHHEVANHAYGPYRTGNLFAGSVMFLKPGTGYEVRLKMDDPDGGAPPPKRLTLWTRREPPVWNDGPLRHVYPCDDDGKVPDRATRGLHTALAAAKPGDVLLLHKGRYRGGFHAPIKGTPQRPIVIRAAGDGQVIVEGTGYDADLLDLNGAEHVHLEGITLRHARTAVRAGKKGEAGAIELVIRRWKPV